MLSGETQREWLWSRRAWVLCT